MSPHQAWAHYPACVFCFFVCFVLFFVFCFFLENVILGSDYPFPLGEHHPGKLIEDVYKDDLELTVREQSHSVSRFFFAIDKTPPSLLKLSIVVIQKFCYHGNVTSNYHLYKHWYRLMITFAKTRFGYIEVLSHTLHCNWGRKYRSLYRGLRDVEFRYIEVPLCAREREIGPTPFPRF